jgi:diadenylate cyclase
VNTSLFEFFGFLPFTLVDLLDILIVAFVFYQLLRLIRGTRAAQMLVGLFLVVTVALAAPWLKMEALDWLLQQISSILLILLVILFQPELRRMLLVLGHSRVLGWFYKKENNQVVDTVARAATQLSSLGYGALIVLGREVGLGQVIESGETLNADVRADLLVSIFSPRSPLHDQAVVIMGDSLVAARCTLPLAEEVDDERLGTRHRAALGLSQETDAITVVVSEENRSVSLAIGGVLLRGLSTAELRQRLMELMAPRRTPLALVRED